MRYELLIFKNGGYIPIDLGSEAPVMVIQVNTLLDLKDINTSYSQSLSLPKSPVNCAAFDYANDFHAQSSTPYAIYPCALYCDGARLIPDEFRLVVKSVNGTMFKCQITTILKGLFGTLGDLTMPDLGLPPIPYTIEEIQASVDGGRDYVFAIAATHHITGLGFMSYGFRDASTEIDRQTNNYGLTMVNTFWPYFRLHALVEKIFAAQGYSLDTSVLKRAGYKDVYVSLSDMKPSESSFDPLLAGVTVTTTTPASTNNLPVYMLQGGSITARYGEIDTTQLYDPDTEKSTLTYGKVYTATDHVNIRVRLTTTSASDFSVRYRVRKYGVILSSVSNPSITSVVKQDWEDNANTTVDLTKSALYALTDSTWDSDDFELAPGEKIYIEANLTARSAANVPITTNMQIYFNPEDNKVPAGGIIDPGINFGFKNQLEVIKLFVQLHGLTVQIDTAAKVVRMHPFEELVAKIQKGVSVDWSEKVDNSGDSEITFALDGYTQRNDIRYKNNDILHFQDTGTLAVNNANIEKSRVMLDLQVLSSRNVIIGAPVIGQSALGQLFNVQPHYVLDEHEVVFYAAYDSKGVTVWPQTSVAVGATLVNQCPLWAYNAPGMHICEIVPMRVNTENPRIGYLPYNMQPPATAKKLISNAKVATYIPVSYFTESYYSALQDYIFNKTRVVTEYIYLTPEDVAGIDLFTPVYIEKYGGYFYIQKIDNYRADTITKVVLIAINI